jgi:hypothetical protein
MLNSEPATSGNRNIFRFSVAAIAMAVLAGCAVSVPLPLYRHSLNTAVAAILPVQPIPNAPKGPLAIGFLRSPLAAARLRRMRLISS